MCKQKTIVELVAKYFRELAELIGLRTGGVRVTISEAHAVKIEARQTARVCCLKRRANEWGRTDEEVTLLIDLAPQFVTERLEGLIVELVGQYGHVEGVIEDHEVVRLIIDISLAPPSRNSAGKRRLAVQENESAQ